MDEHFTTSLCVVVAVRPGEPRLLRVADLDADGVTLVPFRPNYATATGQITTISHAREYLPPAGTVGFWDWQPKEDGRTFSWPNDTVRWVQYVKNAGPLLDVPRRLGESIGAVGLDHDFLLDYGQSDPRTRRCLHCRAEDLETDAKGIVRLESSVLSLPRCEVPVGDIQTQSNSRYGVPDFQYVTRLPASVGHELVRTPFDTVRGLLLNRLFRKTTPKKSDRQVVRSFLESIHGTTLTDDIAAECGCDRDAADRLVQEFLRTCEEYFNAQDIDSVVFQSLIDRDADVASRFRAVVEAEWIGEHEELVEATARLAADRDGVRAEIASLVQAKDGLTAELEQIRQEHEEQMNLGDQVADEVRRRVEAAQADVVSFLADHAMLVADRSPKSKDLLAPSHTVDLVPGGMIATDPPEIDDLEDLVASLTHNLGVAGVAREHARPLAAYLLAAYAKRVPLILAGQSGQAFADALSVTLRNKLADRVYCFNRSNLDPLNDLPDGDVVAVYDGLQGGAMSRLLTEPRQVYMVLIALTGDEMVIEPAELYDYALPLLTRILVDKVANPSDYQPSVCRGIPETAPGVVPRPSWPKEMPVSLARRRGRQLLDQAAGLAELSNLAPWLLQVMPLLLASGEGEVLLDMIDQATLSDTDKNRLRSLVGVKP
jgi:hypothetical protein